MADRKRSRECQRLIELYAQSVEDLSKAVAALALSHEIDAFDRAWRLCEDLQGRCREIHRELYDSILGHDGANKAAQAKGPSILIFDDQVLFRRGLRHALAEEFPGARWGESRTEKKALVAAGTRSWDIVIVHVGILDRSGYDAVGEILRQHPQMNVLVLLDREDRRSAGRLLRMGARGCVSKEASPIEVVTAVRAVLSGKTYIDRRSAPLKVSGGSHTRPDAVTATKALSDRERQIAIALAGGRSLTETAHDLNLSVKTVSTYKRRILNKLRLDSIAELVRYAIDHKLS